MTDRQVTVKQTDLRSQHGYFYAYCHQRRAHRTFRTDRVLHAHDLTTGVAVPDLWAFLDVCYRATPDFALDELWSTHRKALRILLYVGRSDGRLSAEERVFVREAARALTQDARITDRRIDLVLSEFEPPSRDTFETLVREVARQSERETRAILLAACEAIVAVGPATPAREQAAIAYVRKYFTTQDA